MLRSLVVLFLLLSGAVAVAQSWNNSPLMGTSKMMGGGGGNTVSCQYGPSVAGVPAPASKAGFNTCLLNADFSSGTTDSNGINWSQPSTWAANCGSNLSAMFFLVLQNYNTNTPSFAPCNRLSIVTDTDGKASLQIQFLASDVSNSTVTALSWPTGFDGTGCSGTTHPGCPAGGPNQGGLFQAMFKSVQFRVQNTSWPPLTDGTLTDPFDYFLNNCNCGNSSSPNFVEIDTYETDTSSGGCGAVTSNCIGYSTIQGCCQNAHPNLGNINQYHTVAGLITQSSNQTDIAECIYVDNGINTAIPVTSCNDINGISSVHFGLNGGNVEFDVGGCNTSKNSCVSSGAITILIRNFQVWQCSNLWNSVCTTTPTIQSELVNPNFNVADASEPSGRWQRDR